MFALGFVVGGIPRFVPASRVMGLMAIFANADERLGEKGEADSELVIVVAFYLLIALIILGMWSLSGWELPL